MELDALLIPYGRRLWDLSAGELCSHVYGWAVGRLSGKDRERFDYELTPDEMVEVMQDPRLPEGLVGRRPPSWWAQPQAQAQRRAVRPPEVSPAVSRRAAAGHPPRRRSGR